MVAPGEGCRVARFSQIRPLPQYRMGPKGGVKEPRKKVSTSSDRMSFYIPEPLTRKSIIVFLNPNGSCQFYFKHKGFGFCVSELLGRGCHAEKARQGGEDAETLITRAEDRKGDEMNREKQLVRV